MKLLVLLGLVTFTALGQIPMPGCPSDPGPVSEAPDSPALTDQGNGSGSSTNPSADQDGSTDGGNANPSSDPGDPQSDSPTDPGQSPGDENDFTPANGADVAGAPSNAPITYGPWNTRLRVATSPDGLTWTRTGVTISDQADVPSVIVADGKLWVFYVIWKDADRTPGLQNVTVAAYSSDLTRWTFKKVNFSGTFPTGYTTTPVDPTVIATVDGGYRMYFTLGPTGSGPQTQDKADTYSAVSADLINWTIESGSRLSVTGRDVLDPSIVWVGDHYEFFAGTNHATSTDGLAFSYLGIFSLSGQGTIIPSNGAGVGNAYKYYVFTDDPTSDNERILSMTYSAGSWSLDDGTRLGVDASTGQEKGLVRDPAVCPHPAGIDHGYVMVYVTGIP